MLFILIQNTEKSTKAVPVRQKSSKTTLFSFLYIEKQNFRSQDKLLCKENEDDFHNSTGLAGVKSEQIDYFCKIFTITS